MQWDNNNTINFVWKLVNSRTASVLLILFNFIVIFKRTFDVSLFYSFSSTYILTFNLFHKVARIFFSFFKRMQEFCFLVQFLA